MAFIPALPLSSGLLLRVFASSEVLCQQLRALHTELQDELKLAQKQQTICYDQNHQPTPVYNFGDIVWLSTKNIKTIRPSKKLDYQRVGPFKIVSKVGSHAYKLLLPSIMKIHP